jgi:hypothetical protein
LDKKVAISLTRLVLWSDPPRIQLWPAILSKVPLKTEYSSLTGFGREYITDRMTDPKHSAAEMITRNLSGIEQQGDKIVIKGTGLLERYKKKYKLSEDGIRLSEAYTSDPEGMQWGIQLAKNLLTREPRTRVLIKLLSFPTAYLEFKNKMWFGGNTQKAEIKSEEIYTIAPFLSKDIKEMPNIRKPLNEMAWWALGKWREHTLLSNYSDCEFRGKIYDDYSLNGIGTALRSSCEVFAHLGILKYEDGICRLDFNEAVKLLGGDIAEDFGWAPDYEKDKDIIKLLREIIENIKSDNDYIVASELRKSLLDYFIENPDKEISRLEEEGRLIVEAGEYGQSRHGEGLYSDPRKQLIKIRIL